MRDRGSENLCSAHAEGWALGGFSTYNLGFTQGIVRASADVARALHLADAVRRVVLDKVRALSAPLVATSGRARGT